MPPSFCCPAQQGVSPVGKQSLKQMTWLGQGLAANQWRATRGVTCTHVSGLSPRVTSSLKAFLIASSIVSSDPCLCLPHGAFSGPLPASDLLLHLLTCLAHCESIILTPVRRATVKNENETKNQKITSVGEDIKKLENSCAIGGIVKWWNCYKETVQSFLKKLKIELAYDPENLLLGIYLKDLKAGSQRDICTSMFIAVLVTIAKRWKQPKCPPMDEWMDLQNVLYTPPKWTIIQLYKRMNEPWGHYPEWNKSVTKRQILCDSTSMKYQK